MDTFTSEDVQIGQVAQMERTLRQVLDELRRDRDYGGVATLCRVFWDPAAPDLSHGLTAEYVHDGSFAAFAVYNLSAGVIRVALSPNASLQDNTSVLTLSARAFVVLPYRGTTVSVSGGAAGSALVVAFSSPQPASAGVF